MKARPRFGYSTEPSRDPSAPRGHLLRPAGQGAGRATEDYFRDGRREGDAAGNRGEAGLQELGKRAPGPQQGQPEETVVPKRRRTDREPSGALHLLIAATDEAEARQAQVAREIDQQPPPGPAQHQLENLGGGGVTPGGGSGGLDAAGLKNKDDWQLQVAAHVALYAPNARNQVEREMKQLIKAAEEAGQEVAELGEELKKAKKAADPAIKQLHQCISSTFDKVKESLQRTMQLLAQDTPDKLKAQQDIIKGLETGAKELKARLNVNVTSDTLRRLVEFDTSLTAPVQKLLDDQAAYQKVVEELHAAETRKAQADRQLEPARGVLTELREHAGQGKDLPNVRNLALWSADLILRLPLEELGATLQKTAEMPLRKVVLNLRKLSELYKDLGQLKGGSLQLQKVAGQPDVFREEVIDYSFWYMEQLADCGPMRG